MKILVVLVLLAILGSLGSGFFYLMRDKGNSTRTVRALTIRVALSIGLFLFLMAGYYFGFFPGKGH